MYDTSGAERLRSIFLQVFLVGLVVVAGLLVFGAVADATTDVKQEMRTVEQ